MNQLEERLGIVQRRMKILNREIMGTTNRNELMEKINALNMLKEEENEILKTLGVI